MTQFDDATRTVTIWAMNSWNVSSRNNRQRVPAENNGECLMKKNKTRMNYWILCEETPQRLKTKAELKDWRALLCVLVCKVWAWTCLTTCCAPDTALITHQSVATNRHTAQREDDKHQLPSVSLTGNRVRGDRSGDKSLNGPIHKVLPCGGLQRHSQPNVSLFSVSGAAPVQFQGGLEARTPVGDLFKEPDAQMIHSV